MYARSSDNKVSSILPETCLLEICGLIGMFVLIADEFLQKATTIFARLHTALRLVHRYKGVI